MRKTRSVLLFSGLLLILLFAGLLMWGLPFLTGKNELAASVDVFGSKVESAQVEKIIEEGTITLGEVTQPYQVLLVRVLGGDYAGIPLEVEYGKFQQRPGLRLFKEGDRIFVTIDVRADGVVNAYYTDTDRSLALWVLFGLFVVAIIWMGRRKGIGALISLAFSLWVIIGFIVPSILEGKDPVAVSLAGSAILLGASLYITYGWNLKTHSAVFSIFISLALTGALSVLFVNYARLSGFGDENALFLVQVSARTINLQGLFLGGMIIGALGVLDDLVTSQTAVAFELHNVDDKLGFSELFYRSMRIGQDHIAATVNTLFLAYTGASLPLLLLFALGRGNIPYLLNAEFVTEEIVRTLVGSIGLILAVPISSMVAAYVAKHSHQLGDWYDYLGGAGIESHHPHSH